MTILLFLLLTLRVPDAEQFVGPPKGTPVPAAELGQRTHDVASLVRCPVCQGMSVADSPSEMAINMKEQVRELLARGYTQEQILHYFELSYGQFVLLEPKFQGVNRLVWLLPLAALLAGAFVVAIKIRNLERGPERSREEPPRTAEAEVDPYVARVRELVGGGKQ